MKITIICTAVLMVLFTCSESEKTTLVGKWQLTEELIDIGDGKGKFRVTNTRQILEFFRNGTFTSSQNLCQTPVDNPEKGSGSYSMDPAEIIPENCGETNRPIPFEIVGQSLILNLPCIEPCKQKYKKVL